MRKRNGKGPDLGPDLPPEAAWIWGAFCELDMTRQNGFGVGPITYVELAAYAEVHGFAWEPAPLATIRALDREFLIFQAEKTKQPKGDR